MTAVIEIEALQKRFGGMTAVDDVSFSVDAGTIVGLIGPNGSGKTTTLNLVNGVHAPDAGTIRVGGKPLTGKPSSAFVKAGVTRTFQNPRVFSTITALENMLVPVLHRRHTGRPWREKADELLDFVSLGGHRDTPASELSGGQQKLLEFVRALMTEPLAVLMDEPFAGVHPSVKEVMRATHQRAQPERDGLRDRQSRDSRPHAPVLTRRLHGRGAGRGSGSPEQVTSDPDVINAYLGGGPAGRGERG